MLLWRALCRKYESSPTIREICQVLPKPLLYFRRACAAPTQADYVADATGWLRHSKTIRFVSVGAVPELRELFMPLTLTHAEQHEHTLRSNDYNFFQGEENSAFIVLCWMMAGGTEQGGHGDGVLQEASRGVR